MSVTPSSAIVGVFREETTAEQAMDAFYNADFTYEQIHKSVPVTSGGFFGDLKNLFTGASAASDHVANDLTNMGLSDEEAHFYAQEHKDGNIILAVYASGREQEAHMIMQQYGAYNAQPKVETGQPPLETTNNLTHNEHVADEPEATQEPLHTHESLHAHEDTLTATHEPQTTQEPLHEVDTWAQPESHGQGVEDHTNHEAQQSVIPIIAPSSDLTEETIHTINEEHDLYPYPPATQMAHLEHNTEPVSAHVTAPEHDADPIVTDVTTPEHNAEPVSAHVTTAPEHSTELYDTVQPIVTEYAPEAHATGTHENGLEPHPFATMTASEHDEPQLSATSYEPEHQTAQAVTSEYAAEHHAETLPATEDVQPITTHEHEPEQTHREDHAHDTHDVHTVQESQPEVQPVVEHTLSQPEAIQPEAIHQEEHTLSQPEVVHTEPHTEATQEQQVALADAPTEPLMHDAIVEHEAISLPAEMQSEQPTTEPETAHTGQPITDTTEETVTNIVTPETTTTVQPVVAPTTTSHEDELLQLQTQIAALQQQLQDVKAQLQDAKGREEQVKKQKERDQLLQNLRQQMLALQEELQATHAELQDTHARINQN